MSLIDQFFEEYDNLMKRYGGVSNFFTIIGDKRVSGYINRSRRDGTMPPPTQLIKFEDYMDNQFLLECMQYYGDNYPDKMTIKMDLALDEFTFKYRKSKEQNQKERNEKLETAYYALFDGSSPVTTNELKDYLGLKSTKSVENYIREHDGFDIKKGIVFPIKEKEK